MKQLERAWYQSSLTLLTVCLLPFAVLFRLVVAARRFLYRVRIKKSYQFNVPVIVVGNITVGGTGKTPFVIWLAEKLRVAGFTPGIVSRGVGGKTKQKPRWVSAQSDVHQVGDEAMLLLQKTKCPLVVGIDRVACVNELLAKTPCDIVISDDGLQHYRLGRQVEIAIVDGARGFGNRQLLPAGPLREPVSRLQSVNFVVINGEGQNTNPSDIKMRLQGDELVSLRDETNRQPIQKMRAHAVAAIGNPARFFQLLRDKNIDIIPHAFPDHYFFKKDDFNFGDTLPIIMTEKDAVKCHAFADERFWVLPVRANIDETLLQKLFSLLNVGVKTHEKSD